MSKNLPITKQTKQIIGDHNVARLEGFSIDTRNDHRENLVSLNKDSLSLFDEFIQTHSDIDFKNLSVFLLPEGNLSAIWDSKYDKEIDVEFFPDHIKYYIEDGKEGKINKSHIFLFDELMGELS